MKKFKLLLLIALMALSMGLTGCSGDDGAPGTPGATGPAGPVTTTDESCAVCHTTDKVADIGVAHAMEVRTAEATITSVTVDDGVDGTGNVTVSFSVTGGTLDPDSAAFTLAQLVPGVGGDASHWESYTARARTKDPLVVPIIQGYNEKASVGTLTDLTGGDWSYTFGLINANIAGDITSDMATAANATSVGGAFDKSVVATYPNVVIYDAALLHRVAMEFKDDTGVRNVSNAFFDFVPDGVSTPMTRNIVTIDACNKCHGGERLHKGYTVEYCVTCHNTSTFNPATPAKADDPSAAITGTNATVALKLLVHKWHMGLNLTDRDYRINAHNPTETTFPQPANNCVVCHNDDAVTGGLAQVDNWKTVPTIIACGSCHDDVDFTDGTNHPGGAQATNANCAGCHAPGAPFDATVFHAAALVPAAMDQPEFGVTITIDGATGMGGEFLEGDIPVATVALASADGGAAVDYMAAGTGNMRNGELVEAELTVYGPRAHADVALGGGGDLLLSTENDVNGFKYTMNPIPADMAGTYLVHFEGADYGFDSATGDYQTHSSATMAFQVGTATVEPKVSGDNCIDCHGATRMHVTGQHAHNVAFDTDECLACHNYSGGYGTPIPQRVHAVHSASDVGADGHGRSWTDVTFPQDVANCQICHTSGKTTYNDFSAPVALACLGCHGDELPVANLPVDDHMLQNGGQL